MSQRNFNMYICFLPWHVVSMDLEVRLLCRSSVLSSSKTTLKNDITVQPKYTTRIWPKVWGHPCTHTFVYCFSWFGPLCINEREKSCCNSIWWHVRQHVSPTVWGRSFSCFDMTLPPWSIQTKFFEFGVEELDLACTPSNQINLLGRENELQGPINPQFLPMCVHCEQFFCAGILPSHRPSVS